MDTEALRSAEDGVRAAVAELNEMAGTTDSDMGSSGRGLREYILGGDLDSDAIGHEALAAALMEFLDRWDWALRLLVDDGVDAADQLGDARATYEELDESCALGLRRTAHALFGNPFEDGDEWDDASAMEIARDGFGVDP